MLTASVRTLAVCLVAMAVGGLAASPAAAAQASRGVRFEASDGTELQTTVTGRAPLKARPVIVEFSPYGRGSGTIDAGPRFNYLLVQIRGTGDSDGRFDALGPRTQADVAQTLRWACRQPWSNGTLGINGFSASAITIYNSLHLTLPCVKAAVLKSGTFELYRDLLIPGGINNLVPGAGVLALIGTPALLQSPDRIGRDPGTGLDTLAGLVDAGLSDVEHPTLDSWWRQRGFRGDVNHLPTLTIDGFFDVESRGAFQGYQRLRRDGSHLVVIGAHDGAPAGTDAGAGQMKAWFEHYLSGAHNGVAQEPRVQMWMSDGDREDLLAGKFVRRDASDWPVPGTRWRSLSLDPARSGSAHSLNDGSLSLQPDGPRTTQAYAALPSLPTNSDPPNTAIVGGFGVNALTTALPVLSDMTVAETLGLSYTSAPLTRRVDAVGPATLDLRLSTTAPQTGIWVVISDVSPNGTPHPVATGRLSTDYPGVDGRRSLKDVRSGRIVQPYGRYDAPDPATPGQSRLYSVELWPIGNRFSAGHRIRVHVLGASLASAPGLPAINTVTVGGGSGSRLLLPELPGSDLRHALRPR
ncbi:MAG: uncharacterized protein QOG62_2212 [Thermoleophilaceae bacterium]|nr:uncharacterized protein [Thermoleophilaceae bacterium]